jgi:hypothetical protein
MKKLFTLLWLFVAGINLSIAGDVNLIAAGSDWKYLDNGSNQGSAWYAPNFNDATWASGFAELGYGDGGETTVLSFGPDANNKYMTTYFRKNFNVSNPTQFKNLYVAMIVDDGAVVYINGVEAVRHNLPVGTIDYLTAATVLVDGHFENTYYYFSIDPSVLVSGNNVIAVEVHQERPNSSDISLNLQLIGSTEKRVVARGADWKFFDQGVDLGATWKALGYNDAAWASGKAILGYSTTAGSRLENTTISYGPSTNPKYTTTYFRKTISIIDTSSFGQISLNLYLDDGAIIYINGIEASRQNMPTGAVSFSTFANVTVGTATWYNLPINKTLLRNGINEFAVEVHQVTAGSSDKYFEFELMELPPPPTPGAGCTAQTVGCFTSVSGGCTQSAGFIIPSTHTFQYIMAQNDPYSIGGGNMAGLNDFTGFLPVDGLGGSSTEGLLMVNHENTTGSVSQIGLHFNIYTGLWEVDSSKAVNFGQVAGTSRNCSGGMTYWKTSVTSEETMTTGDANSDGYIDLGWHVEINPRTGRPMDYDNNGTPDKMWALGRSNKENIVFKSDSLVAYFGLDDTNNGFIFKFVANQKGNFSSGNLYVLTSSSLLSQNGTWVQVPNTTQADRNNSQSLASSLGARNYTRVEDVEIGPDGMIYFAATTSGRIYRFQDNGSTINNFEIYIEGNIGYTYAINSGTQTTTFASADNLAFDNEGNLWINCDGGCSPIWVAKAGHSMTNQKMELFARTPSGSESTGATFSPDGKFMFLSIQHPNTTNNTQVLDAAGNNVVFNRSTTVVIARRSDLGADAAIPFVDLGPNQTVCANQTIILNPGASFASFLWNTGATTQSITVNNPGTYSVTVTGSNGKTNSSTVNINHLALPILSIVSSANEVCQGDSVSLQAQGAQSYIWSNGILNNQAFVPSQTNTYSVTGTATNGCENSDSVVVIVNPLPILSINGLNTNYSVTDADVTLVGNPAGGVFSGTGIIGNTFSPSTAGIGGPFSITYSYTDPVTGCQNVISSSVTVEANVTGLINIGSSASYKFFPNPFQNNLSIQFNSASTENVFLNVSDIQGKTVYVNEFTVYQGENRIELLELNQLSSGIYNFSIKIANSTSTQRIIKK